MQANFAPLNAYFDHVYVLTIEAAASRRERFARRFEGLNYQFFYGADKSGFSIDALIAEGIYDEQLTRKHHRYNKAMSAGEIACSWSHRMIYEDMMARNFQRVLILEDDAVPNSTIISTINNILSEIPADLELLMWGWAKNGDANFSNALKRSWYHLQHALGMLKWNHSMIANLFARPFSQHLKKAGFHDYTYAYSITQSAAKKLIQLQTPIQYIADNLLAHAITNHILNGYICDPPVFLHDSLADGTARDSFIRE